ncbi:MAG: DnaB-like helicase C-terminal domain-containing protein [bacterium]|nr:DnaB-like helicase C-terminal domain-containing protein [bacterium]
MNAHASPRDYRMPLPDNVQAEQAVLGAIMISNDAYWRVAGFLQPQHFTDQFHQKLYEAIGAMISGGRAANPVTIKPYIAMDQMIGDMTAMAYLAKLAAEGAPSIIGAYDYGRAVIEMWARRQLIEAGNDLIALSRNMPVDMTPEKIMSNTDRTFVSISNHLGDAASAVTMADAVGEAMQSIDDAYRFKKRAGVSTGIEAVDQLTGPWESGQQIIIGGGTKQGKSALAMQCAIGLAANGPVWVYSGEMSRKQIAMREIARRTGIPVKRQKQGRISQAEWTRLEAVTVEVNRLPILIEKRRLTLDQIHSIGRDLKRKKGLVAMVVDHVGLLDWPREDRGREEAALSAKATQQLKAIFEDLGIVGVSLVQLKKNTFVEYRAPRQSFEVRLREAILRRPKYTDLMGAVERDADHVLIPFNARPILASLEPEEGSDDYLLWEAKMAEHEKRAEIILALSREESFPQRRQVEWHGETTSFGPPFVGKQESLLGDDY